MSASGPSGSTKKKKKAQGGGGGGVPAVNYDPVENGGTRGEEDGNEKLNEVTDKADKVKAVLRDNLGEKIKITHKQTDTHTHTEKERERERRRETKKKVRGECERECERENDIKRE